MLVWAPDPVWNTTRGNSPSRFPSITSCAAWTIRSTFSSGNCQSHAGRRARKAFARLLLQFDHGAAAASPALPLAAPAETQEMLDFCGEHNITADVEVIPIQKVNEAYDRLLKAAVKYRFVIDMASLKAEA
jgi:hypothetical protein